MGTYTASLIKLSLLIVLGPLGLFTKVYSGCGSEFVTNYLGGILYVMFLSVLASLAFPQVSPIKISLIVLSVTCLLEFSQLFNNELLDDLRTHFIFRTLIGSIFNIVDFVFYFAGAAFGYGLLMILERGTKNCVTK